MHKDLTTLRRLAESQGWDVSITGGQHMRWRPPNGGAFVSTSATPSDSSIIKTIKSDLAKAGLILDRSEARRAARRTAIQPDSEEN